MGKKKPFIDKATAANFHLVHRSQRDPLSASAEASQHVLVPGTSRQRRVVSQTASESSSRAAWLAEQDLAGFDPPDQDLATTTQQDFSDLGFSADGYDYGQHLREIRPDGMFIPRSSPHCASSVASAPISTTSHASRLSKASILLRGVAGDAFESAEELPYSVVGTLNSVMADDGDSEGLRIYLERAGAEDLWTALNPKRACAIENSDAGNQDADGEECCYGGWSAEHGEFEELNDDFVLQADRPTELLPVPERIQGRRQGGRGGTAGATASKLEDTELREGAAGRYGGEDEQLAAIPTALKKNNPLFDLFPSDDEGGYEEDTAMVARIGGKAKAVSAGCCIGVGAAAHGGGKRRHPILGMLPSEEDEKEEEALRHASTREEDGRGNSSKANHWAASRCHADQEEEHQDDGASILLRTTMGITGGDMGGRTARFLDERFSKLLFDEYEDEEIGELDPDDPRVNGQKEPLEDFDSILDEYLDSQKKKFVQADELMGTGSARAWVRPQSELYGSHDSKKAPLFEDATVEKESSSGGSAIVVEEGESSDASIEDHPFFDGLKKRPNEQQWDAETILTTYTTRENHPTTLKIARKPKARLTIGIDPRTGLPFGTRLPAEEERLRASSVAAEAYDEGDGPECGHGSGVNAGVARPKKEGAAEKRQRKAVARAAKAERRQEKKGTREAFREEKAVQLEARQKTATPSSTSLSCWRGGG